MPFFPGDLGGRRPAPTPAPPVYCLECGAAQFAGARRCHHCAAPIGATDRTTPLRAVWTCETCGTDHHAPGACACGGRLMREVEP